MKISVLRLMYFIIFYFGSGFLVHVCAQPQSYQSVHYVEKTISLETEEKNPTFAKKELIEKITSKIAEDEIKEIIGESKFNRNQTLIMNKVIKNSSRFIPLTKTSDLMPISEGGFKISMTVKMNLDDLKTLLLENGLFYESDSTPIILPVISILDKVRSQSFSWWQNQDHSKSDLTMLSNIIENTIKQSFSKSGFYVLRPQALKYSSVVSSFGQNQDWQSMAQNLNSQILIQGDLQIAKSNLRSESFHLKIHLEATQVQNGRSIAEVVRTYETDAGGFNFVVEKKVRESMEQIANDLSSQVLEAWQKGTIGSNLYRLSLNGHVPIQLQESLKLALKDQLKELKNIKERLISADQIVYEIDTNLTPKEIKEKLPKWMTGGYSMAVESFDDSEIRYKVSLDEVKK